MKKSEFSKLIGVTARRCAQLIEDGLVRCDSRGDVDAIPSLVTMLAAERTRNSTRDAKARLTEVQIQGAEIRARRQMRRLLTVPEVNQITSVLLDEGFKQATNLGGALYYQLLPTQGEMNARIEAYKVSRAVQGLFLSFRAAAESLCEHLEKDMLPDEARIDQALRSLIDKPQPVPGEQPRRAKPTSKAPGKVAVKAES